MAYVGFRRLTAAGICLVAFVSSCGGGDDTVEAAEGTPLPVLTSTVAAVDQAATPADAGSAAEAVPTATPPSPPPPPQVSEQPTEAPTEVATAPPVQGATTISVGGAQLAGVVTQTPAEDAIATLTATFGTPSGDTGWIIGCPLDSAENLNERVVSWGSLEALFYLEEGGERFVGWRYRLDPGSLGALPGGPGVDQVQLPGGARLGAVIEDVAASVGIPASADALTGATIVQGGDFVVVADGGPGTPATSVHVPVLRACE
jgi:hypothetical protein